MESAQEGHRARSFRAADGLTLAFRDYGSPFSQRTPVICLAGLTRNSKDFDPLARRLASNRRVLTLDARGRGASSYDPKFENYNLIVEVGDALQLVSSELRRPCAIVGTSRGGLQALILNGVRPDLVRGVALNDVGPELAPQGLARIFGYLGIRPEPLESWADAVAALKANNAADFQLSEAQWLDWAKRSFRETPEGRLELDYDPKMRDAALAAAKNAPGGDFWPQFRALADKETLLIRGENSDLLTLETVAKMRRVKPDLVTATVRGRGHAPFLDEPEALNALDAFLARLDSRERAL
ncbi:alpha/beta fold hydrolase [Neomegalonema perideroedes]|uniref:alpha/beta fold hydrolase n=1 Tax=Neomegalonema perideroedes TaxID=217219 RepID=UPI000372E782|nr:alpha/beta hydrolase [Neomegalonema perideroedes]